MSTKTVGLKEVAAAVLRAIAGTTPAALVEVGHSAEDDGLLCVRIFGVPEAIHAALGDTIVALSDVLFPDGRTALLPMPKTAAVTQEYYPEQYLRLLALRMSQACASQAVRWGRQEGDETGNLDAGDEHLVSINVQGRRSSEGADRWHPTRSGQSVPSGSSDLDLAA